MINWKEVELSDKDSIQSLLYAANCTNADYSFANLYIWRNAYRPQIAFNAGRLLIKLPEWDVYSYPIGDGDIVSSIDMMIEEAHSRGTKIKLRGLTDSDLREFIPLYGESFEISEDRDNAGYIYTADKLCNLPGRHLASKRNHINKFERNGSWEFRKITPDLFDEARAFIDEFYVEKDDPSLISEANAINEMFEHYDELGVLGGLLYQEGRPVAFSAGTQLSRNIFDVHFEKALPHIEGAYAMINREFARMVVNEIPDINAFNREEDMGLEGLRKAKLSYHPDLLLMEYFATEK